MRWSAFYRISHRIVPRYRQGRVFLAGDAAHLHPPLGGQGMNAGLQDAYNLAWKLALAVRGRAADDLLDSYNAERRPVGLEIVERTTKRMDRVLAGDVGEQEPVRADSQLFTNYRDSAWVANDDDLPLQTARGPLAGDRAPRRHRAATAVRAVRAAAVRPATRPAAYARAIQQPLRPGRRLHQFAQIDRALREQYGETIQTVAVLHADCERTVYEGLAVVVDARGEFAQRYGAEQNACYLIRPDGYLAYRARKADAERISGFVGRVLR